MDRSFVALLNVLALLREKPMTFDELLKTGCFKSKGQLIYALKTLLRAGCIEKITAVKLYVILGRGLTFLTIYPNWQPLPAEVLDIVAPIGGKHENI